MFKIRRIDETHVSKSPKIYSPRWLKRCNFLTHNRCSMIELYIYLHFEPNLFKTWRSVLEVGHLQARVFPSHHPFSFKLLQRPKTIAEVIIFIFERGTFRGNLYSTKWCSGKWEYHGQILLVFPSRINFRQHFLVTLFWIAIVKYVPRTLMVLATVRAIESNGTDLKRLSGIHLPRSTSVVTIWVSMERFIYFRSIPAGPMLRIHTLWLQTWVSTRKSC